MLCVEADRSRRQVTLIDLASSDGYTLTASLDMRSTFSLKLGWSSFLSRRLFKWSLSDSKPVASALGAPSSNCSLLSSSLAMSPAAWNWAIFALASSRSYRPPSKPSRTLAILAAPRSGVLATPGLSASPGLVMVETGGIGWKQFAESTEGASTGCCSLIRKGFPFLAIWQCKLVATDSNGQGDAIFAHKPCPGILVRYCHRSYAWSQLHTQTTHVSAK